jgi:hypothetical protein
MNSAEFRKELEKAMPGYRWSVHKSSNPQGFQSATAIMSSGFNRLSTFKVIRTEKDGVVWYEVMSAGYGTKSPWAGKAGNLTLARALRDLQKHYEWQANHFRLLASQMEAGRKQKSITEPAK